MVHLTKIQERSLYLQNFSIHTIHVLKIGASYEESNLLFASFFRGELLNCRSVILPLRVFIHPRWWSPDFWTINSMIFHSPRFDVFFRYLPTSQESCQQANQYLGGGWRSVGSSNFGTHRDQFDDWFDIYVFKCIWIRTCVYIHYSPWFIMYICMHVSWHVHTYVSLCFVLFSRQLIWFQRC